ncbi:hypothetical protein V7075_09370 [Neobacillus drentensis]|uniref:hypothetical protein n=1 Tax=Neobacillus drentensis TaxID=220684 RepID=UPI002FFE3E89
MGLRCASCGVRTNPTAVGTITLDFTDGGSRTGTLTLDIDVCADRLGTSTVFATFEDLSGIDPNRSFTFTSTSITSVLCTPENENCLVNIQGMGLVSGEMAPRNFLILLSNVPNPANDQILIIRILDYVINEISADLTPDLTFFGCPTT